MKPFLVLIITYLLSLLIIKIIRGRWNTSQAGRIAMSVMLVFTAIAHFTFTKGMEMMIPDFIPFKTQAVYATGIMEILFAIALQVPSYSIKSA